MAGKFTNLNYDTDAYNDRLRQSTDPLLYRLDPNFVYNCNKCYAPNGARNGYDAAETDVSDRIDVDSLLKGIGKYNSKSNAGNKPLQINYQTKFVQCTDAPESESTRQTTPAYEVRGMTVSDMRFDYPLHDPQCHIFENFSVNTRLQAKDNHRTIWQEPIDQSKSLPKERIDRIKKCKITVDCGPYAPYE